MFKKIFRKHRRPNTPEYLVERPENLVQPPEYLVQPPEYLVQRPECLEQRPEYLVQHPEYLLNRWDYLVHRPEYLAQRPEYLVQQPKTLERLAVLKIGEWIVMETKALIPVICEVHRRNQTQAKALLWQRIEIIRNRLECNVPRLFYNEMSDKVIRALSKLHTEAETSTQYSAYTICLYIIRQMVQTLFTNKLTNLKIFMDDYYRDLFYTSYINSKAYLLTGLTYLEAPIYRRKEYEMIMFLKELHNLKYLILHSDICTVGVIKCLAENCKLIEEININTDESVNDYAMDLLTELKNLRIVKLIGSKITYVGLKKLLKFCKELEHIECNEELIYALYSMYKVKTREVFKLKYFKISRCINLRVVSDMCPYIETLEIDCMFDKYMLKDITGFKYMRNLKIRSHFCKLCKFLELLEYIGKNLVHLEINNCLINLNVLKCIGQLCSKLENFSINTCLSCRGLYRLTCNPVPLRNPPFKNLKHFTYDVRLKKDNLMSAHEQLDFILENCSNIEYIHLCNNFPIRDDFLLKVLDKNPMKYLTNLNIGWNLELTKETIDVLIQNCSNPLEIKRCRKKFTSNVCW